MPNEPLTVDEAMAAFSSLMDELPPPPLCVAPAECANPEDADAACFRFAEHILSLACPGPTACQEQRCRRQRQCRHFADMRALRPTHPRRPPGAAAVRYAIWIFMNAHHG